MARALLLVLGLLLFGAAGGCGSRRLTAAADAGANGADVGTSTDAVAAADAGTGPTDAGTTADVEPEGPLRPIILPVPPEVGAQQLVVLASHGATASNRRWISAQSTGRAQNGPVAIYEQDGSGAWAIATTPPTVNAYYPFLCAVSDDEVYAAVTDRTMPEGLIFARVPGSAATFVAEAPPPIPAQSSVERVQLACFPGGNLWAYGTIRSGGGSSYFVQHRASGGAAWAPVALPPRAAGTTNYAVSSALLRADGSGYFAFYDSFDRQTVFERRADGSWVESLVLDPNSSVATFAGDPGGHAVAAINASDARYLELRQGVWSVVPARGFRSVRGAAVSPSGLVLTGAMGTELTMAYGREPGFAPVDLGLPGTLQQIVFPTASDRRALLITYGNPSLVTAYDWVP